MEKLEVGDKVEHNILDQFGAGKIIEATDRIEPYVVVKWKNGEMHLHPRTRLTRIEKRKNKVKR